jgi:hypothetical protein
MLWGGLIRLHTDRRNKNSFAASLNQQQATKYSCAVTKNSQIVLATVTFSESTHIKCRSRDSVVSIATGYGLEGVEIRVPVGSRIFSFPRHPDRLWGPFNLLSNEYRGLFFRVQSGRGVKLTTHLQLVLRSRKCGSIHLLPHTPS